ncbi:hypothetical protein [Streptomyces halstedii]|uniref:hypothetical protein n=1 Tax=Streptomyces halstedii TaxID=1944 RepID=UPI00380E5A78
MDDVQVDLNRDQAMDGLEEYQKASVLAIEAKGFELKGERSGAAIFADKGAAGRRPRDTLRAIGWSKISEVADDFINGVVQHEEYAGVVNGGKGVAEYYVRVHRSLGTIQLRSLERLDWDSVERTCEHDFTPNSPISAVSTSKASGEGKTVGFHVNSRKEKICVELSLASQTAEFLTSSWSFMTDHLIGRGVRDYSLKVFFDRGVDAAKVAETSLDIVSRIIFELDIRNGISLILSPRERVRFSFDAPSETPRIRFPKVKLPREVAALFSFASETLDNPPYVFLSYYQVLENFLPLAHRRDALKVLQRELRDPFFDENKDSTLIKLLNSIDRTKQVSEEDQLKLLLRDFVRPDKLIEFFGSTEMKHFESKGPIVGVPEISMHPKSDPLSTQVAKRVYALRNRIVHAKDDPKYGSIPVLLPRSAEAGSLKPDVALARLLATEVLINGQD